MEMVTVRCPLDDSLVTAVAHLVADHREPRDPSHSAITELVQACNLEAGDLTEPAGKERRVRSTLSWATEWAPDRGGELVVRLIARIRSFGGFRPSSSNYVGAEAIENAQAAFRSLGYELASDGDLRPLLLDNLAGREVTEALWAYIRRARAGWTDAALVTGTGKDLVEATAAHVLVERFGHYSTHSNFPTLLGQAFTALGLTTTATEAGRELATERFERTLFEAACAVNGLRNTDGTGHGRPFQPEVTDLQAKLAIRQMGDVAELLLDAHASSP